MDSNTHSTSQPAGIPTGLAAVVAELQELVDHDPDRLSDATLAERVRVYRGLMDRLEGHWLAELATVDARGPPGLSRACRPARPPPGSATASA
jgi:hypothetical protein